MFSVAGRDGLLPTISAFLHIKRLTPVVPCIVEGILGIKINYIFLKKNSFIFFLFCYLAVLYVLVGDADRLLGYLSFSTWLICLCGAISMLIFRHTMRNVPRPFHAGTIAPIIFIIGMSLLTLVNIIFNPIDILVGMLILLSGLPVYWIFVVYRSPEIDKFSQMISIYLQKLLLIVPDNNKEHD
jgi:L-type amino acid transporter 8